MNKDSITYTIIFSFIIGFVFVFVLAFVNEGTKEQIEANRNLARQRAVLNAFGIKYDSPEEVFNMFEKNVKTEQKGDVELFSAELDGKRAYAHMFTRTALWGSILGVIAVNGDLSRTLGLEIIEHNETPGLGGRIDEPWFKEQFRNEKISNGKINMNIRSAGGADTDSENSSVDAITGATLTSTYMQTNVNAEIQLINDALEGKS